YNTSLNNRPVRRNGIGGDGKNYTPTTMVDDWTAGSPPTHTPDTKWDYEAISTPNSFTTFDIGNLAGGNNIYIIYTLPD
ncbi:MAG: hypothetical protein K2H26_01235, partial [Ruminococcus sp.]|nr:hypothetical protein [Ruminococcus sp.]